MKSMNFSVISQKRFDPQTFEPFVDFCVSIPAESAYHLAVEMGKEAAIESIIEAAKHVLEQEIRKTLND